MTPTVIRSGELNELATIGHLLATAFDEPVTRWLVPDPDRHLPVMSRFFTLMAGDALAEGEIDVLTDDAGLPVAAALWFDHTDLTEAFRIEQSPAVVDQRWQEVFGPDAARWRVLEDLMTAHHLHGPHWYLFALGVHPEVQGRGLGRRLLDHGHQRRGWYPTYLESTSPDSRRLYTRCGYIDLGQLHLPDGPPLWRMTLLPNDFTPTTEATILPVPSQAVPLEPPHDTR